MFEDMNFKFVENVTSSAKEFANSITDTASQWYTQAKIKVQENIDSVEAKYEEAKMALFELETNQKLVDKFLAMLPNGPDKERLLKERDEARSFFSTYVAPLVNKLIVSKNDYNRVLMDNSNKYQSFAALPVGIIAGGAAVVAASTALIYYAYQSNALEQKILDDPSLTQFQKYGLTFLGRASGYLGMGLGVGIVAWLLMR